MQHAYINNKQRRKEMKKTVLIIEDDANQLMMLKQLVLSVNEGAEILTADNETIAYKILMERTIDVFLVDIILDTRKPGDTSGVRLVERMRKIQKYIFTPVIFITFSQTFCDGTKNLGISFLFSG